jgi:predicted HicB family RNase H-like nuclease
MMSELLIPLSPDLERRLTRAAAREGMPVAEYVTETLKAVVPAVAEEEPPPV